MREVLRDRIEQNREAIVRQIVHGAEAEIDPSLPTISADSLEQMANGFVAMLLAGVAGDESVRTFYSDTVLPGVRDSGTPLQVMIGGSTRVMILVSGLVASSMPEEHRGGALHWLADYLGSYLADVVAIWERTR